MSTYNTDILFWKEIIPMPSCANVFKYISIIPFPHPIIRLSKYSIRRSSTGGNAFEASRINWTLAQSSIIASPNKVQLNQHHCVHASFQDITMSRAKHGGFKSDRICPSCVNASVHLCVCTRRMDRVSNYVTWHFGKHFWCFAKSILFFQNERAHL